MRSVHRALAMSMFLGSAFSISTHAAMYRPMDNWPLEAPIVAGVGNVTSPATGMILYDTSTDQFKGYSATSGKWQKLTSNTPNVAAVTSAYSIGAGDDVVLASGGSFTVTLPDATVDVNQKIYRISKTDTSLSNAITIGTTSSQTIGGIAGGSYVLHTGSETLTVVSDGANWQILEHRTDTGETDSGAVTITGTTTNPAKGTTSNDHIIWSRHGKVAHIRYVYTQTAAGSGSAGSGDYLFAMPTNLTIDTTNIALYTTVVGIATIKPTNSFGTSMIYNSSSGYAMVGSVYIYDSTHFRIGGYGDGVEGMAASGEMELNATTVTFNADFDVPISGWQP